MVITVWDPSMKVNYLSKIVWDSKIITEFTSLSAQPEDSKDKYISRLTERTWSMSDEVESKTVQKDEGDQ